MNIAVIGASAGLGLEVVKRALQRNHAVTALSRSSLQIETDQTIISIQGSATSKSDLSKAIQHADAVIVALGTGKNMKATTLFSDFAKQLVAVQEGTKSETPVLFVTGFGAGESQNYVSKFVKLFLKFFLKDVYADKTEMENIISHSKLNWIGVRPGRLMDGALTEKYRLETTLFKGIKIGAINRTDLADFLVKQAENPTYLKQFVSISNK